MRSILFLSAAACVSASSLRFQPVSGVCSDPAPQEAGYYDIDAATNKHYFYYMASSRNDPVNDPVVLWLTGERASSTGCACARPF